MISLYQFTQIHQLTSIKLLTLWSSLTEIRLDLLGHPRRFRKCFTASRKSSPHSITMRGFLTSDDAQTEPNVNVTGYVSWGTPPAPDVITNKKTGKMMCHVMFLRRFSCINCIYCFASLCIPTLGFFGFFQRWAPLATTGSWTKAQQSTPTLRTSKDTQKENLSSMGFNLDEILTLPDIWMMLQWSYEPYEPIQNKARKNITSQAGQYTLRNLTCTSGTLYEKLLMYTSFESCSMAFCSMAFLFLVWRPSASAHKPPGSIQRLVRNFGHHLSKTRPKLFAP